MRLATLTVSSLLLAALAVFACACGSSAVPGYVSGSDADAGKPTKGAGSPSTASDAGLLVTDSAARVDSGLSLSRSTADAGSCGNILDLEGCACNPGAAPHPCYTGPASQAGVGACSKGMQVCIVSTSGEITSGMWGMCTGQGSPSTCSSASAACGSLSDGCGGVLSCGTCPAGETCGAAAPNACGTGACVPATCESLGLSCGSAPDGCTGTLACGSCSAPATCGGGGTPGSCGCTPQTCVALGATCGSPSDGCGGTLDCGACAAGTTCGGGGLSNLCGAPPTVAMCGPLQSGCFGCDMLGLDQHPEMSETTAAACQAYCNSFSDTVCCGWDSQYGYCYADANPACKTPVAAGTICDGMTGWSCMEGAGVYGAVCQ